MLRKTLTSLLLLLVAPAFAAPSVTVPGIAQAINFEASPLGGAWRQAAIIPNLVQQQPDPGAPTAFKTRIKLLHTRGALYIAVEATDPDPGELAIHSLSRDADQHNDDHITLVLDPMHSARQAFVFQVNAGGARRDGLISPANGSPDWTWNGIWNARVWRTKDGWAALVKIPFATLRFNPHQSVWGLNISRYVPRDQLTLTWAGHTLDSSVYDLQREGTLTGLRGLHTGSSLRMTPYVLASAGDTDEHFGHKAGITVTGALTPGLTGALTVRPNFAEAEAQSQQINLTPYPLFLPETRQFFLEGANLFTFASRLGNNFIPFYSRRVGLVNGQVVPIDAGAKVVGQTGPVSIGALDVQTASAAGVDSQNLFAGRAAWNLGQGLSLGTILTHGDPTGTTNDSLYGADAVWQTSGFRGDKNLQTSAWAAHSSGTDLAGNATGWGARIAYPNDLWQWGARYDVYGNALDPALGFLPRPGTRQTKVWVEYDPRPQGGPFSWARQFFFQLYAHYNTDLRGDVENWSLFTAPFNVDMNSGAHYEFDYIPQFQHLQVPFEIANGVTIPAGDYRFATYHFEAQSSPSRPWQIGGVIEIGSFYDGHLTHLNNFIRFSTHGGHWSFALHAEQDFGHLAVGNFVTRLYALGVTWTTNPDVAFSNLLQYNTVSHRVALKSIFRWIIRPGSDLYIVFDHNVPVLTNANPTGNTLGGERLTVKLAWTFER